MKWISLSLFLIVPLVSQAEYRVFTLNLTNTKTNVVRQIRTTLDPDQYKTIYPLNPDENMTYVQTWRCQGRTDFFKPYCDQPSTQPTKAQN